MKVYLALVSLEAVRHGCRKKIACPLSEWFNIKEVKQYLRIKSKKNGATRKTSTTS
jgi:hypothetical protein